MLESIMYFGVGFLFAALIGLAIFLRVRGRAVRLTTRQPDAGIPPSFAEVQIDKDLLQAQFAMSTRRPETIVEPLDNRNTSQLAELGRKGDVLGRLMIERNPQQAEITALKSEVEALLQRLTAAGKEVHAEGDVIPLAPTQWPTALVTVPADSSRSPPLNDRSHDGDVVSPVRKQWHTLEIAWPDGPVRDLDAGRSSSDPGIGSAREKYDFPAGLREPTINVFPRPAGVEHNPFAREGTSVGRRVLRTFVRRCVVVLIGGGLTVAWQYHGDDIKETARSWVPWPGSLSSVPTTSPPASASVGAATSPEVVQQPAAAQDLAGVRPGVDQPAAKQEQPAVTQERRAGKQDHVARNVAAPQAVEQDVTPKTSSVPRQPREKLTAWPDTRPATIAGWTVRDVTNGTALLEGPGGVPQSGARRHGAGRGEN